MTLPLTIAWLGNLIDMAATLILVAHGYHEANPIMRPLLNYPILFAAIKLGIMTAVLLWLWHERESKLAVIASWIAAVLYGGIAAYYVLFPILFM